MPLLSQLLTPNRILNGDALSVLRSLPSNSVHCCVTSPPFWKLRSYLADHNPLKHLELGQEATLAQYIDKLVEIFRELRRVLRDDGVLWLNLGDTYIKTKAACSGNLKVKDLAMVPHRVAIALQDDGWYVRGDVVWEKPNAPPESAQDRPMNSHESVFLLTKTPHYFYDRVAIKEPCSFNRWGGDKMKVTPGVKLEALNVRGLQRERSAFGDGTRNKRSVWKIPTVPYKGSHFAVFPPTLPEVCIKAGTSEAGCCPTCGSPWQRLKERTAKGTWQWQPTCQCPEHTPIPCTVLDVFAGSNTTLATAQKLGRRWLGIELNADYLDLRSAEVRA